MITVRHGVRRTVRALATAAGAVVAVTALVGAAAAPSTTTVERVASHAVVTLSLTPRVPAPDTPDLAERPAASTRGPLLLFLPATGSRPQDYRAFYATAVSVGYHVLGLTYANRGRSVARTCETDATCYTDVQDNRLTGADPSRFSRVHHAGGILDRFVLALHEAQRRDPRGDWRRYLIDDERPDWGDIVIAGHSQGGGECAFIAHRHEVRGALMFSSPVDDDRGIVPTWMHGEGATPVSRMYAFDDAGDMYARRIVGSWRAMGLGAHPVSGVPASPRDHVLLSTVRLGTPLQSHMETVDDAGPGVASGHPLFAPEWRWMLRRVVGPPPDHDTGGHQQTA